MARDSQSANVTPVEPKDNSTLKAAEGLIATGPDTGYPVEHHGLEITAPLDMNSVLMKLAKTPAESADTDTSSMKPSLAASSAGPDNMAQMMSMNVEMISMLSGKLDTMISALENGNETSSKLLKRTSV